jgi:hypothetical protein
MADNIDTPCWCTELPPIAFAALPGGSLDANAACFCPACLALWKMEQNSAQNKIVTIKLP